MTSDFANQLKDFKLIYFNSICSETSGQSFICSLIRIRLNGLIDWKFGFCRLRRQNLKS